MGQENAERPPNVIIIFVDDMGYADVSCYGNKRIETPHIDALAKSGVRCTNGYVSAPQCAPSRAGLLTGKYQQRFGFYYNPKPGAHTVLPLAEKTVADHMKAAGYVTGMIGKWHLGFSEKAHPCQRGFDEFFGNLGGFFPYLPPTDMDRNGKKEKETAYATAAFSREAVKFIRKHSNKPFFLYLPYNAPHGPLQATEALLERVAHIKGQTQRTYAAMTLAIDDGVGAIVKTMKEKGLEEKTLIFFISDNGATKKYGSNIGSNLPHRAFKGSVFDGGIRVPFIASWKGKIPAGTTYVQPIMHFDATATALQLAGVDPDGLDGVDLMPFLNGKDKSAPHEALFWKMNNFGVEQHGQEWQWAVRQGDWKAVVTRGSDLLLFNLKADLAETKDLAAAQPERAKALKSAYETWCKTHSPPRWPPYSRHGSKKPKKRRKNSS